MSSDILSDSSFRDFTIASLRDVGFNTRTEDVSGDQAPIVLAENPYYLIAFQVYPDWNHLTAGADTLEIVVADLLSQADNTPKTWDAYLVLVCRSELTSIDQYNELASLTYNVRGTRKIIRTDVQDNLSVLEDVLRPFLSLTDAKVTAKDRDPLGILSQTMIDKGLDRDLVEQMFTTYRESGGILDDFSI